MNLKGSNIGLFDTSDNVSFDLHLQSLIERKTVLPKLTDTELKTIQEALETAPNTVPLLDFSEISLTEKFEGQIGLSLEFEEPLTVGRILRAMWNLKQSIEGTRPLTGRIEGDFLSLVENLEGSTPRTNVFSIFERNQTLTDLVEDIQRTADSK